MSQNLVVADDSNNKLKLFDMNGIYLSSVDSMHSVRGITSVTGNCFATCGLDRNVILWTLRGVITIEDMYDVDHFSHGIHYNGTYYSVLHNCDNAITVLDTQGRQVRQIVRKEVFGKDIEFGEDIHMDRTTHNIYVVCFGNVKAVLCLSLENEALWFKPLMGGLGGITAIDGILCVSDRYTGQGIHMVSKSGKYKGGKLLDKDLLKNRNPEYLCYVASEKKLYFNFEDSDIVCYMSLQFQH